MTGPDGGRARGGRVDQAMKRRGRTLLRRRWLTLLLAGLSGVALGLGHLLLATPLYTARAELLVTAVDTGTSDLAEASSFSRQQAGTYAAVATRPAVLDPALESLGLLISADELAAQVSATVPPDTSFIEIEAVDASPEQAAAIANAVAVGLVDISADLVPRRLDGTLPVRLLAVQRAEPPRTPSTPEPWPVLLVALLAGLLLGVVVAVGSERTRGRVHSAAQAAEVGGLPVLGSIGTERRRDRDRVAAAESSGQRGEEVRWLQTHLHVSLAARDHAGVVVTSAVPGEGKTSVAVDLAAAMASAGRRVCLVEADLRHGGMGALLGLDPGVGLTTVLSHGTRLEEVLQPWGRGVEVLLAGPLPPEPGELLGSPSAQRLLVELGEHFDDVVIDCPPLDTVSDAAGVAAQVGGALLVVALDRVRSRDLGRAVAVLRATGPEPLGIVANFAPRRRPRRRQRPPAAVGTAITPS